MGKTSAMKRGQQTHTDVVYSTNKTVSNRTAPTSYPSPRRQKRLRTSTNDPRFEKLKENAGFELQQTHQQETAAKDDAPDIGALRSEEISNEEVQALQRIPLINKHFKVLSVIGKGTFSTVFKIKPRKMQTRNGVTCAVKSRCYALKKIVRSCRTKYIQREIECLIRVGGGENAFVSKLHSNIRIDDIHMLLIDYCDHEPFLDYHDKLTACQLQRYMKGLLSSIAYVHSHSIIHRDVKPANFLFHRKNDRFMLVDFGLTQSFSEVGVISEPVKEERSHTKSKTPHTVGLVGRLGAATHDAAGKLDSRKPEDASRAGTRGFRAPEVLLRVQHQSPAIDVWSAGVIMLTILCARTPLFLSDSDHDSLCEIAVLFGVESLQVMAKSLNKEFLFSKIDDNQSPCAYLESWMKKKGRVAAPGTSTYLKSIVTVSKPDHPAHHLLPDSAFDLLKEMLQLHPYDRIKANKGLKHQFFQEIIPE
eukprot:m.74290 g.74290  ORF g.74290 m.74290 type:complete len:476 (-) comp24646_c0_seq1:134-1561(-)